MKIGREVAGMLRTRPLHALEAARLI